ncbi:MAG TPA: DUF1801 domain-containing protein [Terriglobales bacterium]|nr:DUF1801 domain-containing protein [Terriglobales bacterium]
MKRSKAKSGKPAPKSSSPKTVAEYMELVPDSARRNFTKLRATIQSAVPHDASETISYRIPAFKCDRILVWYAAFTRHCSLFPTAAVIEEFKKELEDFSASKGTIQFPNDESLPTALIKKIVKSRVAQSEGTKHR